VTLCGKSLGGEPITALAALERLQEVELIGLPIDESEFRRLCGKEGVTYLSFTGCDVTDAHLNNLTLAPTTQTLNLRGISAGPAAIARLRARYPMVTIQADY
jgi:hypothetical protein